jgi:hypothetical protein
LSSSTEAWRTARWSQDLAGTSDKYNYRTTVKVSAMTAVWTARPATRKDDIPARYDGQE